MSTVHFAYTKYTVTMAWKKPSIFTKVTKPTTPPGSAFRMPQWEGDATIEDVSVQDISDGLVLLDKHHIFETVKRIAKRATHLSTDRLCAMQERVFRELSSLKIALLVVDFQNDFISGSLRVQDGSAAEDPLRTIPLLNRMLDDYPFDMVVFTQDWHPENHISFIGAAGDPDRKFMHNYRVRDLEPFDRVAFKVPSTVQVRILGSD
ncbi:unnamed protein product [Nippostrongylus brasiliensis]|uniref:Isochorismatase domain-containing protein n=1 Tax=Nippostrongylus brasiliensis TaxID=27835 RepID=A0A0N4YMZ6_NIPBR|nr:unnamed protein product [Nippostrongylus brasiliensis]